MNTQKEQSGISPLDIGWVRQRGAWRDEFLKFVGRERERLNWVAMCNMFRAQIEDCTVYYDDQGNRTKEASAKIMRLETDIIVDPRMLRKNPPKRSLQHDESCCAVIVFKRDADGKWQGVDFEYGRIEKVKRGFYRVGYANICTEDRREVGCWTELCRLAGERYVDKVAIDELIESQEDQSYCNRDGTPANAMTAQMRVFRTGLCFSGTVDEIYARFVRGKGNTWRNLSFVSKEDLPLLDDVRLPYENDLFRFADFPSAEKWLPELKRMALPEKWTLKGESPNGLLRHYLKNIFIRSMDEGSVAKLDGVAAAFDTGLVDCAYRPIYAYFVANENKGAQPMKWKGFCFKGENLGKEMLDKLGSKLGVCGVNWFAGHPERMHLDPDAKINPPYEHGLIDRAFRLPDSLWKNVLLLNGCNELWQKMEEIYRIKGECPDDAEKEWVCRLRNNAAYGNVFANLKRELDSAVELAKAKVRYDYTTAVPIYYPTGHCFSFVLPLSFSGSQEVKCALVVERKGEEYQGHTILTSKMAYSDARLLRRPNEAWLRGVVEA